MTEPLNEQLSALLDGELAPEETELLMKRLARDATLRATLGRYALCGEALRASAPFNRPRAELASRISAAILADPTVPMPSLGRAPSRAVSWLKPMGGLAVAATVAALAVLVLGRAPERPTAPAIVAQNVTPPAALMPALAPTAAPLGAGGSEPASYTTPAARRATVASIPAAELANYVVAHAQYSSLFARRAVMSGLIDGPPPAPPAANRDAQPAP